MTHPSLLLVGCGNMAGAMLAGWLDAGLPPTAVTVVRPSGQKPHPEIRTFRELPAAVEAQIVLLGVKPQKLDEVAPALAPRLASETILLSILAGVELAALRARFPAAGAVVRAMPNLPVRLRKGVIPLVAERPHASTSDPVTQLTAMLGTAEWFDSEDAFALAGHLTAAAPAFLYRFIDALASAAIELGLGAEQSTRLALAMVEGAGALAASAGVPPGELARRVASPGGTTEAGLRVLDQDEALRDLIRRTLTASKDRGEAMAAAARAAR